MTYTQVFPSNPIKVNGYYLDYTFNSDSDTISFPSEPIIPGVGLGGFFSECSRRIFHCGILIGWWSPSVAVFPTYGRNSDPFCRITRNKNTSFPLDFVRPGFWRELC
jgi:hypothetical protein